MLLETLIKDTADEKHCRIILVIISQVNLLICLFNDILDLKMIEEGNFVSQVKEFKPHDTFKYVL